MISPDSTKMKWSNDTIAIDFILSQARIYFTLQNLSTETMKIIWDETTIIRNDRAMKVMHSGVKYIDRSNSQPPTTIPGKTSIDDNVLPVDNVRYREGYYGQYSSSPGGWVEDTFYPDHDYNDASIRSVIPKIKGKILSLVITIEQKNIKKEYKFDFEIASITETK
jgi:hypothetical protein